MAGRWTSLDRQQRAGNTFCKFGVIQQVCKAAKGRLKTFVDANFISFTLWRISARDAPSATMDILVSSAYLCEMISRFITILAIFAITVVTTVSSAHAARMSIGPDHTAHAVAMMPSPDVADLACGAGQSCGSADAEMCEFVCTGLSVFLTSPGAQAGHAHGPAGHDFPSEAIHVSRAPGLNERPPKIVLL